MHVVAFNVVARGWRAGWVSDWLSLVSQSSASSQQGQVGIVRRRRRNSDEEVARAARALSLVQLGEISVGQQALEGASFAPGNLVA